MRYLLPLTLATVAALSATGCVGPNLQGYKIVRASDPSAPNNACRLLADPRDTLRRFCVSDARWQQYDAWAATAGVTCRQIPGPGKKQLQDACLTAGLWRRFDYAHVPDLSYRWDGGNPGGTTTFYPVDLPQPYAVSYGPFPSGGAIGQTFR
jgi:hypothetical protein